jgi:Ca2+/H+ antiporter
MSAENRAVIGVPALTPSCHRFVAAVALAAILDTVIVIDGESTWLERLALVGLYVIMAAGVWWGPPVAI